MIIVAESGSTKTEWMILSREGGIREVVKTQGYNPYFHSSEFVEQNINSSQLALYKNEVSQLFFYGAGCSSAELNLVIENGLKRVFKNAIVQVEHDLLAAAYSVYQGRPVIACILGTGSNSVYFDGEAIQQNNHALGFILGDEGSGCYFGKKLLQDYFYGRLPRVLHNELKNDYELEWKEVVPRVYNNVHANVYLASFMPFLAKHLDSSYVTSLIEHGFSDFVETHIHAYELMESVDISFVGSIAYHFQNQLENVLGRNNIKLNRVIRKPAGQLVEYHRKYVFPTISV